MNNKHQIRFAFMVTLGCLFFAGMLSALIFIGFNRSDEPLVELPTAIFVFSEILIIVPLVVILRQRGVPLGIALRLNPVTPVTWRDSFIIGVGLTIILDELDRLVSLVFPMPAEIAGNLSFLKLGSAGEAFIVILGAAVLAPLVEEVLFRGFFQRQLEKGYRDVTKAILFSSALFTVAHFNPWWSIQIYTLGMVLGYLAWRTESVWPPTVLHVVNNGAAVWFANTESEQLGWFTMGSHVSVFFLIAAAGCLYFGFRSLMSENPVPVLAH